jgi:hypothetical protein
MLALASALGLSFLLVTASGFNLISPARKWFQGIGGGPNDLPVLFLVNDGGETSVTDGDNGVSACRNAIAEWENEVGVNLVSTGTTSSNAVGNDGQNVTSFEDPAKIVRNAIAVTLVGFVNSGQTETVNGIQFSRYLDTDTSFSKRLDFTSTGEGGSCSGEYYIEAVETHEIGHALGLDHSASGSALMYPSIGACDNKSIGSDDHDGINTIYTPGFGGGTGCTPSEVYLTTFSCNAPPNGPNCLTVTCGVSDDCGDGVSGADVTVTLAGNNGDNLSGTATTGSDGTVTFGLRCRDADSTVYTVTVTTISAGLSWNSNAPENVDNNPMDCNTR